MPLFRSRPYPATEADNHRTSSTSPSARKGSIFSKRSRSHSPTSSGSHYAKLNHQPTRRGFFATHNSSDSSFESPGNPSRTNGSVRRSSESRTGGGLFSFGRGNGNRNVHGLERDPTILAARGKVMQAEEAEKEADRALMQARGMVKEAREHVKILEQEAVEDARRAKAKQAEAKFINKSARGLGRHG